MFNIVLPNLSFLRLNRLLQSYHYYIVTQSKTKTQITRSVHCKFNCMTVNFISSYDAKQVQLIEYMKVIINGQLLFSL